MFFVKRSTLMPRAARCVGLVGTVSKKITHGCGKVTLERMEWLFFSDYDFSVNSKVVVVDVADKMSLKVKPIES